MENRTTLNRHLFPTSSASRIPFSPPSGIHDIIKDPTNRSFESSIESARSVSATNEVLEGMWKRLTLIARERDKEIQIDRQIERERSDPTG